MSDKLQKFAESIIDNHKTIDSFESINEISKNKLSIFVKEFDSLLPCEKKYANSLKKEISSLETYDLKINKIKAYIEAGYVQLNSDPLGWTIPFKDGFLPRFAIVNVDSQKNSVIKINYKGFYYLKNMNNGYTKPSLLSKKIKYANNKKNGLFHSIESNDIHNYYKASFSEKIPESTKIKIKLAKNYFNNIFMIFEPKWKKGKVAKPADLDPLIVGIDGDDLWLIDIFDATPSEKIFSKLYSKNKKSVESDDSIVDKILQMVDT